MSIPCIVYIIMCGTIASQNDINRPMVDSCYLSYSFGTSLFTAFLSLSIVLSHVCKLFNSITIKSNMPKYD